MQMVENYDEVTRISSLMKYPPMGKRTFGVNRAQSFGLNFEDYVKNWNQESILIVQIESKEGVNNIESITSHPAVDGVMIGPYDLSGSYGVPGETNHPIIKEASKKVINACKKNNKSCGTQIANPDKLSTQEALDLGYTFLIMGSDLFLITNWSRQVSSLINNIKMDNIPHSISHLFSLEGKFAVITGGGGHLCSAIAAGLAMAGTSIAVVDMREEKALKVANEIKTNMKSMLFLSKLMLLMKLLSKML